MLTTVANRLIPSHYKKHPLGHVIVQLSNETKKEKIITGSVLARDSSFAEVDRKGYGLGILYAFVGGRLEATEDLDTELIPRFEKGK